MPNAELITIERLDECFDNVEYVSRHKPRILLTQLHLGKCQTIEDAVNSAKSLLSEGYNPYMIYNTVQRGLGSSHIQEKIIHRKEKRKKRVAVAASIALGATIGAYCFSGDPIKTAAVAVNAIAIPGIVYYFKDMVALYKKHPDYLPEQLKAINAFLEGELQLPLIARDVAYTLSWGQYRSEVHVETVDCKGIPIRQVHHLEVFEWKDREHELMLQVENGMPVLIEKTESFLNLPIRATRKSVEAFGALVHPYLRFYSGTHQIVQFQ